MRPGSVPQSRGSTELKSTEIKQYERSRTVDGVRVHARCYSVDTPRGRRYEIHLVGLGQRAVVDSPGFSGLQATLEIVIPAFARGVQMRNAEPAEASVPRRQRG